MATRLISALLTLSLAVGLVSLPSTRAAAGADQAGDGHHACCPRIAIAAIVVQKLPSSAPCGPDHNCCRVRPPAKAPSGPGTRLENSDPHISRSHGEHQLITPRGSARSYVSDVVNRVPLDSGTVLRI